MTARTIRTTVVMGLVIAAFMTMNPRSVAGQDAYSRLAPNCLDDGARQALTSALRALHAGKFTTGAPALASALRTAPPCVRLLHLNVLAGALRLDKAAWSSAIRNAERAVTRAPERKLALGVLYFIGSEQAGDRVVRQGAGEGEGARLARSTLAAAVWPPADVTDSRLTQRFVADCDEIIEEWEQLFNRRFVRLLRECEERYPASSYQWCVDRVGAVLAGRRTPSGTASPVPLDINEIRRRRLQECFARNPGFPEQFCYDLVYRN